MIVSKNEMFKYYYQNKEQTEKLKMSLFRTNIPNHFYPVILSKPYIMDNYIDNVLFTQSHNGNLHGYSTFWVMFSGILITIINSENISDINILSNALKEGEFLIHKTNVDNIVDKTSLTKIISENSKVQEYYFNNN